MKFLAGWKSCVPVCASRCPYADRITLFIVIFVMKFPLPVLEMIDTMSSYCWWLIGFRAMGCKRTC